MTSYISIEGRLTADAEMRYTPSGHACLDFTVADNHRIKRGDEWADDGTSFWRVTLWRQDAETYADKLTKGTTVIVTGEPRIREYETREGGKGKSAEIHRAIVGIRHREQRQAQVTQADPWAGEPTW